MPISTSSSPSSKVGDPAAGTVQEVRASPIDRTLALTSRARSATEARSAPSSALAPTIFSISTVPPTPRRPWVYSESLTATSSAMTTASTSIPSALASSAASSKFMMSPV